MLAQRAVPLFFFTCSASSSSNHHGDSDSTPQLLVTWPKKKFSSASAAAMKRIPMETAGAYQLVNEETGEKVIVWGDSQPIPSQEALSWNPSHQYNHRTTSKDFSPEGGLAATRLVVNNNSAGDFGRLKAQKIRNLMKRSSGNYSKDAYRTRKPDPVHTVSDDFEAGNQTRIKLPSTGNKAAGKSTAHYKMRQYVNYIGSSREGEKATSSLSMPNLRDVSGLPGWGGTDSKPKGSPVRVRQQIKLHKNSEFFSRESFKGIGCSDDMIESLTKQCFFNPSHIQAMAYGPVLEGKSCIIADQSGSGKTLAYLAPIIQRLRQEEVSGIGTSLPRSPRIVILVPTAELASQVLNNCRSIAKFGVPFRSMAATGGFRQKTQLASLYQEVDVLIATPGRFSFLLEEGFVKLTNLKCVVLDEVDILFGDEDFEQVLQRLINAAPVETQYLFVTATLPVETYNKLVELFPDSVVTMGPGVHRTSSRLEEVLVDCSGVDREEKNQETAFHNKKSALLRLIEESPVPKTIVFCNKIDTCRKVENVLKRFDRKGLQIKVLPFHAALTQEVRLSNIEEFLNPQSEDSLFLVSTDRASRGIDFANVDHVVLFDYPRDPSEYVRRVGRTARGAGGKGKAFIFAVGKQVSLARKTLERNRKGHPLHDVPSAYELEAAIL